MGFSITDPLSHDYGTTENTYASFYKSELHVEPVNQGEGGFLIRATYFVWLDRQARLDNKTPIATKEIKIPFEDPTVGIFEKAYTAAKAQWSNVVDQV